MSNKRVGTICKLFQKHGYRYDLNTLFSDCIEMMALAVSNSVDVTYWQEREDRYMKLTERYDKEMLSTFTNVLAEITLALEEAPGDIMGEVFHALELHNKHRGQFFTPYNVCSLMAKIVCDPKQAKQTIDQQGFISVHEPAVGAGAMIIAMAETLREEGINYQQTMHVQAVDIDRKAVHMAYVQFSLLHIPAVLIRGDSIAMTCEEVWLTPAHILGRWTSKLKEAKPAQQTTSLIPPKVASLGQLPLFEPG